MPLMLTRYQCVFAYVCSQLAVLKGSDIGAVAGGQADAEALIVLKDFMNRLGCENLCTEEIFPMDAAGSVITVTSDEQPVFRGYFISYGVQC